MMDAKPFVKQINAFIPEDKSIFNSLVDAEEISTQVRNNVMLKTSNFCCRHAVAITNSDLLINVTHVEHTFGGFAIVSTRSNVTNVNIIA
jgi:hypothetical protein